MSDVPPGALTGLSPEEKRAMLARLLRERAEKPRTFPASWAQRTLWFLEQMSPGRATYNMHAPVRVEGPLDPELLERAITEIVRRHEALRTTFTAIDGEPVQVINPAVPLAIPLTDLRSLPEVERTGQARRAATEERRKPFDLARGPLFRIRLLRLGEEEFVVLLTLHHINADGWSIQVFKRELVALYDALARGLPSPLPELPIQYADYAVWQRRMLEEGSGGSLDYWRTQLAGVVPLDLPTDRPRPAVLTVRGASRPFLFPANLADGLRELCRRARCTPFMALLAAFQVLLHRYSGQDDIAVGSPYANRTRPEVEGLIGYFVNMLVLRGDLASDPSFLELLTRTRQVVLDAIKHQDLPFNKIVEELRVPRDLSRHPLFQVMFVYQNTPRPSVNLDTLKLSLTRQQNDGGAGAAKFELTLAMSDSRKGLKGRFQYNSDLFDPTTIDRMIGHFRRLLEAIVADPSRPISQLDMIDDAERELLTERWAFPQRGPASSGCVHQAFESQARRTPDALALIHGDESWTYHELNRRANQVAHHLRAMGVGPESRVGLVVDRSPALIVGLFGIQKAGAAYVPIDPAQPRERLRLILDDSGVEAIVSQERHRDLFQGTTARLVMLDSEWPANSATPEENPPGCADAASLAYILYTSGTTGRPKGVMIEHGALAHYTEAAVAEYGISASDRVLQFASIGFDASAEEIFPCLTRGGTVVLRAEGMLDSYAWFLRTCGERGITVLSLPTAYWHELTAAIATEGLSVPASLRLVIIGGEAALAGRLADWQREVGRSPRLLNTYGPTEATVVATSCDLGQLLGEAAVPIGRPLRNVRAYVLDRNLAPVPTGVPGEIFLGGAGLARGYANRPGTTADRFLPNPFSDRAGDRLYRTGDLGRWRPDGQLEYLGRSDEQVKIRGHRIELGEVESALLRHPAVQEAAALALDDAQAERRLVAYVVFAPGHAASPSDLRAFLREHLPEPMVPSAVIPVGVIPRSSSGKIDRASLPEHVPPEDNGPAAPPRTETERGLVAIWTELLGRETVGIDDSFFDLGGHSLLAIRAAARIREEFHVDLPLQRLFLAPTIAALAPVIEQLGRSPGSDAPEISTFDIEADGTLDPKIRPAHYPAEFVTDPARILLTGATGFLGGSLLCDLLSHTEAEVACLVRSASEAEGLRRLRESLEAAGLWDGSKSARIAVVRGDLAQPRFGLSDAEFSALADRIEVIYHNAALVNTIQPYEMLRDVNVLGTQDVLRLAATGRTKTVHHVSTLTVLKSLARSSDGEQVIRETDPLGPASALRGGYGRSKWAAERLMVDARARGIPVCIYRVGRIAGHSRTGRCDANDMMFRLLKVVKQSGTVPTLRARLNLVPVDFASRAIVHLSRRAESRNATFHLLNPAPAAVSDVVDILRSLGAPIRAVSLDEWTEEIQARGARSSTGAVAALAVRRHQRESSPRPAQRRTIGWTNTREGLAQSGIACPAVDRQLVQTYYSYLIRSGLLDAE